MVGQLEARLTAGRALLLWAPKRAAKLSVLHAFACFAKYASYCFGVNVFYSQVSPTTAIPKLTAHLRERMHLRNLPLQHLIDYPPLSVISLPTPQSPRKRRTEPMAQKRILAIKRLAHDQHRIVLAASTRLIRDLKVRNGQRAADRLLERLLRDGHAVVVVESDKTRVARARGGWTERGGGPIAKTAGRLSASVPFSASMTTARISFLCRTFYSAMMATCPAQ